MGMSRFPDPYQTRDDLSHATVFLIALLLLITVGGVLFFGNSWLFAPASVASGATILPTSVARVPSRPTPAPVPTFGAPTPVPPLSGALLFPTAFPSTSPTPRGSTFATPAPSNGLSTALPTVPPLQQTGRVANTNGDGVFRGTLRTPRTSGSPGQTTRR